MGYVEHKLVDLCFASSKTKFVAVCACGWRSPPCSTAGLAHAMLDLHAEEQASSSPRGS